LALAEVVRAEGSLGVIIPVVLAAEAELIPKKSLTIQI
jgi:hypothetical protein